MKKIYILIAYFPEEDTLYAHQFRNIRRFYVTHNTAPNSSLCERVSGPNAEEGIAEFNLWLEGRKADITWVVPDKLEDFDRIKTMIANPKFLKAPVLRALDFIGEGYIDLQGPLPRAPWKPLFAGPRAYFRHLSYLFSRAIWLERLRLTSQKAQPKPALLEPPETSFLS